MKTMARDMVRALRALSDEAYRAGIDEDIQAYTYIAQDTDGEWYLYTSEPELHCEDTGVWDNGAGAILVCTTGAPANCEQEVYRLI